MFNQVGYCNTDQNSAVSIKAVIRYAACQPVTATLCGDQGLTMVAMQDSGPGGIFSMGTEDIQVSNF